MMDTYNNNFAVIIGADFVPTKSNYELCSNGYLQDLFGEKLVELIQTSGYAIFNLETPLVDEYHPILKCGPALQTPQKCALIYSRLGVNLLTLANNHIMDQGTEGLESTLDVLSNLGVQTVGAGMCLEEATKGYTFCVSSKKYAVYACAEHEFSIASSSKPGANPFDPLYSFDHVRSLSSNNDFVIVLYHGGKEYYRYPSPELQRICRKFIESGANLVVCQHSHCIGCKEEYANGTIVYGQGNFLFDDCDHECWKTGLLIGIENDGHLKYIPLVKQGEKVRLAESDDEKNILSQYHMRSEQIKQEEFIRKAYQDFADSMIDNYLSKSLAKIRSNIIFRILNKLLGNRLLRKCFDSTSIVNVINTIECEAHREVFLAGLKNLLKQ